MQQPWKKATVKTNLYLRRVLSKTSNQDKAQRSIVQQLDIWNNENTFYNRNILTTANIRKRWDEIQRNARADINSDIGGNKTKTKRFE